MEQRNIVDVVKRLVDCIPEEMRGVYKTMIEQLEKCAEDSGYTAPEAQHRHWFELSRVLEYWLPDPIRELPQPAPTQPEWVKQVSRIIRGLE